MTWILPALIVLIAVAGAIWMLVRHTAGKATLIGKKRQSLILPPGDGGL